MADTFDLYNPATETDFGTDLTLTPGEEGGDLVLEYSGEDSVSLKKYYDIGYVSGNINLRQAISRRLSTAHGAIKNFVRDYAGLYLINSNYGNPAYKYLSEPMDAKMLFDLKNEIMICLQDEDRIQVNDVTLSIVPRGGHPSLSITITYTEVGTNQGLNQIVFSQVGSGFVVV